MKPFIETFTGVTFSPLAPSVTEMWIEDIAHALANQGRFSGHTRFRYSVGEHSVRVSELIEEWGHPRIFALWGLLHDASEAYLVDLPTPLKDTPSIGEPYKRAEIALMQAVCCRFGLPIIEPAVVRKADASMLATEVRDLMHGDRDYWKKITAEPIGTRIRPWGADVTEYEFLRRFEQLGGLHHG
jgi:5'-deoxynucleotidase YfbR-like HD superfamily hydrolase